MLVKREENAVFHLLPGLKRRTSNVGQKNHVFHRPQGIWHSGLSLEYIEASRGKTTVRKRLNQFVLINDLATGNVDESTFRSQGIYHLSRHEMTRTRPAWTGHNKDV